MPSTRTVCATRAGCRRVCGRAPPACGSGPPGRQTSREGGRPRARPADQRSGINQIITFYDPVDDTTIILAPNGECMVTSRNKKSAGFLRHETSTLQNFRCQHNRHGSRKINGFFETPNHKYTLPSPSSLSSILPNPARLEHPLISSRTLPFTSFAFFISSSTPSDRPRTSASIDSSFLPIIP